MPAPNPKAVRAAADGKDPLDYLEPVCDGPEARVLKAGADKYGRRNFAGPETIMLWSTYIGSLRRHVNALAAGEDTDPDTGEQHLAHIRANTAVLMAAAEAGTLVDDRLNTEVLDRSREVHEVGNHAAKADDWPPLRPATLDCYGIPIFDFTWLANQPHGTQFINYAVEPFVVEAVCCATGGYPNSGCEYRSKDGTRGLCTGMKAL